MQQPQIILLKEGTDTSQGKPQLISNINACYAVADVVRCCWLLLLLLLLLVVCAAGCGEGMENSVTKCMQAWLRQRQ